MKKRVVDVSNVELSNIAMHEFWYDYFEPKNHVISIQTVLKTNYIYKEIVEAADKGLIHQIMN